MDLYSTARRLARPFRFDGDTRPDLPIGARGIIGDGITCALVRVDGAIDWMCFPRFDSPSCFGALLDDDAGITSITPVGAFESLQRYDPDTNVLETLFRTEAGVARLDDFMPWTDDPRSGIQEVHRRLACVEGEIEVEVVFDPRFDYGRAETHVAIEEHGVMAVGGGQRLAAIVGAETTWDRRAAGGVRCVVRLRRGQSFWMVLSGDAPTPEPIEAYRCFDHLRATRHRWREWCRKLTYDGPWRHHVMRSALTLKLLTYAPTGAMVAAPTTSLPEWIGGQRNWDYRYTWTRDAAMSVRAMNLIGCAEEASDFFHFVRDALSHEALQIMYTIDGGSVPEEQILGHLAGFRGSAPVRIGNGARDQVQLDIAGALIDSAHLYEHFGGSLTLAAWRRIRGVIDGLLGRWRSPDHGIWEPRDGAQQNVYSKLMCWIAFDRGAGLAPLFGDTARAKRWGDEAKQIHADVCSNGLDATGKHFVSRYGGSDPDASLLMLTMHGFLPPDDPRMRATLDWVRAELGDGSFIHRYQIDDGVGGPEGSFVLCGFWLAEALAMDGRLEEAQEVFVAHAEDASNHLGLLAEEVHPQSRAALGNFPQAFSHLGLINAALRIDRLLRLRDFGRSGVPRLVRA